MVELIWDGKYRKTGLGREKDSGVLLEKACEEVAREYEASAKTVLRLYQDKHARSVQANAKSDAVKNRGRVADDGISSQNG